MGVCVGNGVGEDVGDVGVGVAEILELGDVITVGVGVREISVGVGEGVGDGEGLEVS